MMIQEDTGYMRIHRWMACLARRDLLPRGAGGDLGPPPIAIASCVSPSSHRTSIGGRTYFLTLGYLSDSRKSMFWILRSAPYGRWNRSTIETSCTRRRSEKTARARPRSGARTYVTGEVLLAAEEDFVPRELGLEEALELLREHRVRLEAEDPASHNRISTRHRRHHLPHPRTNEVK